jgi:hypothetical protein
VATTLVGLSNAALPEESEMKQYIGVKLINAKPMTRAEYNAFRGWELPADENGADEGFLVEYVDGGKANTTDYAGYVSWSPKDVFARAYQLTDGMTFGMAVEAMKQGFKVARDGWNGKGMFVYYVQANYYQATSPAAKSFYGDNSMVPYRAYIAMKTVDNDVVPWVASQSDILANDWNIV